VFEHQAADLHGAYTALNVEHVRQGDPRKLGGWNVEHGLPAST
jgi:hypothetical protein